MVEKDGEIHFWVNGKEVDESKFNAARGKLHKAAEVRRAKDAMARFEVHADAKFPGQVKATGAFKPRLGVVLGSVSDELAEKIDVDSDEVILIERVIDGTPAAKAGLKSYDVLFEFDGEDDLSVQKLRKLIAKQTPGAKAEIAVIRNGDVEEFEVVVVFQGAGYVADVLVDRETGRFDGLQTTSGVWTVMNDLHKGRNTGTPWRWFIDVFSIACVVFCLTGLWLLIKHSRTRPSTWPLVGLGLVIPVLLAILFVHG